MARTSSSDQPSGCEEEQPPALGERQVNSELAKAFQELVRGEQTASALEARLDGIESKIEQLLASFEANQNHQPAEKESPQRTDASTKPPKNS